MAEQNFTDEVLELIDMRENVPVEPSKLTTIEIEGDNNYPTIMYGTGAGAYVFYRICPYCGRFVKADDQSSGPDTKPNATCKKHGRVEMPFVDYAGELGWDDGDEENDESV